MSESVEANVEIRGSEELNSWEGILGFVEAGSWIRRSGSLNSRKGILEFVEARIRIRGKEWQHPWKQEFESMETNTWIDERRGRLLLEEIMAGGNFGHYDERNHFGQGALWHNIQRFRGDWRMLRFYPSEALSEPLFRVCHFLWRWKQKHTGKPKEHNCNWILTI